MDKKELGRKITELFRDVDKEVATKTLSEINEYLSNFYRENIQLNAMYDDIRLSSSQVEIEFVVKHITLHLKLDETIIEVQKNVDGAITKIDKIVVENENVSCKHGEFTLNEIDNYLVDCFQGLF